MNQYERTLEIPTVTAMTAAGDVVLTADTSGVLIIQVMLEADARTLGMMATLEYDGDILYEQGLSAAEGTPSATAPVGNANVRGGLGGSLFDTRETLAWVAPVGTLTGTTSSRLEEIRGWGGVYDTALDINGHGLISSNGTVFTYALDGILYTTDTALGITVYSFPSNGLVAGAGSASYLLPNAGAANAVVKDETMLEISERGNIADGLFIERPSLDVMGNLFRLSEMKRVETVAEYQNGFFKVFEG